MLILSGYLLNCRRTISRAAMAGKTSFVKIGVVMILALLITNIIMMVALHEHVNDTTVILKEYKKSSSGRSGAVDIANHHKGHRARDKHHHGQVKHGGREHGSPRHEQEYDVINKKDDDTTSKNVKIERVNEQVEKSANNDQSERGKRENSKTDSQPRFRGYRPGENTDIDEMIKKLNSSKLNSFFPVSFWTENFHDIAYHLGRRKKQSGGQLAYIKNSTQTYNWEIFHAHINKYSLYDPRDPVIDRLLDDMVNLPIKDTDDTDGGTELKVIIEFSDGSRAIMKPMRYPRDWPQNPNLYIFDDFERHHAEIAAFHLDRLLGFGRVPPVVGRRINLTEFEDIAPKSVSNTFYVSPAGNICFYGKCTYFCDSATPFCGNPEMIEVSMMAYLPSRLDSKRNSWYQPYRRSYSKFRKAAWEKNEDFCKTMRNTYPFNSGNLLLNMIDAHTFDFLNGNKDRHSFSVFKEFGNFSFPILFDNGRGYGRPEYDPMSILAPLRQCCVIRKSTFLKYVKLYTGDTPLSVHMMNSLSRDPVSPVLIDPQLEALDRRLVKILKTVAGCLQKYSVNEVIIYDRY